MSERIGREKVKHSPDRSTVSRAQPTPTTTPQSDTQTVPDPGFEQGWSNHTQAVDSLSTTDPATRSERLLQLQRTHGNRYVQRVIADLRDQPSPPIQRKEVQNDGDIKGTQDWTTQDRESNSKRWQDACYANLKAVDSSQYVKIVERRDFYKWFYEYTASKGYTTRWALAARLVANGAHQIADMDTDHAVANETLDMANVELQGAMREGNQVIFDNVLPKLKALIDNGEKNGPLTGRAALEWDMKVLAEEQTLIQPLYSKMSQDSIDQMDYIARKKRFAGIGAWWTDEDKVPAGPNNNAGKIPAFDQPNLRSINDRWKYGMGLGNTFTPGGSGWDPNKDAMPAVDAGYQNGAEFAKVDTRHNLHELDAWLNPNRIARDPNRAGSDIGPIINGLTPFEKQQILADKSPDGWAYSIQFAQFISITEAMVTQALPSDPASAGAVAAFLTRFRAERKKVEAQLAVPMVPMF